MREDIYADDETGEVLLTVSRDLEDDEMPIRVLLHAAHVRIPETVELQLTDYEAGSLANALRRLTGLAD